jgi:two-component system, chemotaxis family, protein-glutamate methylesterase/glutaminase
MPVRVLVVDDSALIRQMLTSLLSADPEIEVIGAACDPYEARDKIKALDPDVITLDVEMPNMNGIAFLERLMRLKPLPVVMVSTLTQKGADVTLLALELGAVDFVAKPTDATPGAMDRIAAELRLKVKMAAKSRPGVGGGHAPVQAAARPAETIMAPRAHPKALVAIGASTGGVEALRAVITALPAGMPPIVITQHMPAGFTARFAQRLDEASALKVFEASDGHVMRPGEVAIAPGNLHLSVKASAAGYVCQVRDGDAVSGHRPSVDVLMQSVAEAGGREAVGGILTGMGRDGARGLLAMRQAEARTIGQNEATSLVYGMPKVAKELGAVAVELPLGQIARRIVDDLAGPRASAA